MTEPVVNEYAALEAAAQTVREYATSAVSRAACDLLEELIRLGKDRLVSVKPEELQYRQGAVKQLQVLKRLFAGDPHEDGRL